MLARSAALLLLLATAASANPNCPSNLVQAGNLVTNSTDSANSVAYQAQCSGGTGSSAASYDIPAGKFSAGAGASAECFATAQVIVQDDFTVIGLPAGTPASIVAVLHVSSCPSSASMADGDGHKVFYFSDCFLPPPNNEVSLPIAAIAGQPFRLTFESSASGGPDFSLSTHASWHFTGLPPGAQVVSCNGYVGEIAVAVKPASWGQLKSMYR